MYFLNMFNKLIKLLFLFGIILTTSNCSTGSSGETVLGRPGSPMWFMSASQETIDDYLSQKCSRYGYTRGTSQFADCMRDLDKSARNRASKNFDKGINDLKNIGKPTFYGNNGNSNTNDNTPQNTGVTNCSYDTEFVSGYNKICSYNCRGSLSTLTIGQYQQCPSYLR